MANRPVLGQVTTANANKDGTTGAYATLVTGAANGTKVNQVDITALVTTTAGMIRFFVYDGTNYRMIKEIPVTAITVSASVAGFTYTWRPTNLILESGDTLKVSTEKTETFDLVGSVTDF